MRAADVGAPQDDTPAFSNVLSQQRSATTGDQTPPASGRADAVRTVATKKQAPLGPDETLSLILDSTALPLMQPLTQTQPAVLPYHQVDSDSLKADTAATRPQPALSHEHAAALLADDADVDDKAQPTRNIPDTTAARSSRLSAEPAALTCAAPIHQQAAVTTTAVNHRTAAAAAGHGAAAAALIAANTSAIQSTIATPGTDASPLQATPLSIPDALAAATAAGQTSVLGASLTTPAAAQPTIQLTVATPLHSPQWPQDFSRQMLHLTQAGLAGHTVQMHVNPPELGPIQITLHLGGESLAQASFVSPHANVRQALENALPHLEQQLSQAGLSLGQANVSDQQAGHQQFAQSAQGSQSSNGTVFSLDGDATIAAVDTAPISAPRSVIRPDALIDTFV